MLSWQEIERSFPMDNPEVRECVRELFESLEKAPQVQEELRRQTEAAQASLAQLEAASARRRAARAAFAAKPARQAARPGDELQPANLEQLIETLRQRREERTAQWQRLQPEAEAVLRRVIQLGEKVAREFPDLKPSATEPTTL